MHPKEARQLIVHPTQDFPLHYKPEAVQRRLATLADVVATILRMLESGSFFFAAIARNQVDR